MKSSGASKTMTGKTIKSVTRPSKLKLVRAKLGEDEYYDDNIIIKFTDGTIWKLASWDYEGYRSGIDEEVVPPTDRSTNQ